MSRRGARLGQASMPWSSRLTDVGAVSPAASPARVLRPGLSADAPFPPHGRAAAGAVSEGVCQRNRDHQRRQRGHGGGHDDAVAAGPRRGLAACTAISSAICCWGPRRYQLFCQYMANADSPTHGREGNAHHGDAAARRLPMISHLGKMPSLVVGGTWAARQAGRGRFRAGRHRRRRQQHRRDPRIAERRLGPQSARAVPDPEQSLLVLHADQPCSTTAGSFPIGRTATALPAGRSTAPMPGRSTRRCAMRWSRCRRSSLPMVLECMTLRLHGHAAYDKGDYVPAEQMREWRQRDPVPAARQKLLELCGLSEAAVCGDRAGGRRGSPRGARRRPWRSGGPTRSNNRMAVFAEARRRGREALSHAAGQERRGGRAGAGLPVGEQSAGVPVRARRGRLRLGLQDLQGADRAPRRRSGCWTCRCANRPWWALPWGLRRSAGEPILEFQFADFSTEVGHAIGPERRALGISAPASRPRCCCVCPAAAG